MLPYYKKYSIIACIIGVAPSIVITTIYPLMTGTIMASTIGGLVLLFAIFAASMVVGFNIMERRAEAATGELLALYNDGCDPEALIGQGADVARNVTYPCREAGAWFMSYYAQALLDAGKADQAREVERGIRQSADLAKKPALRAGILVNLIPLADKLDGTAEALELIGQAQDLVRIDAGPVADERRAFLDSQEKVMKVRQDGDAAEAAKLDAGIRESGAYPMRIRVEAAWAEARACFKLGDAAGERGALNYVVDHGNKLALVPQARQRLASLG